MQLSVIETQPMLVPILKTKQIDLAVEILSKIEILPESEQTQLLALVAPKLQDEKLKRAFHMALHLEDGLSKGLGLIEFLPYIAKEDIKIATDRILGCIESLIEVEDKACLIESFIKQLEKQKSELEWFGCLTETSQELAAIIKASFELNKQILLECQCFKLMYWDDTYKYYSLCFYEKKRLIETVQAILSRVEKYSSLLNLLKYLPLEQEEINNLACLALEVLREGSSENSTDSNDKSKISLEEKVRLLAFLPKEYHKGFGKELYDELCKGSDLVVNDLINLDLFVRYYKEDDTTEENYAVYASMDIFNILDYICKRCQKKDEEYLGVVALLTSEKWTNNLMWPQLWVRDVLEVIKSMKSPITQADGLLLLLERVKPTKLKKEIVNQTLETISLVKEETEAILLTSKLLKYLAKSRRGKIVSGWMGKLNCPWNEGSKPELLMALLPYMTLGQRKKAYLMAIHIGDYFDTSWTCLAFAPYLPQEVRERVIQDGFNMLNKPAYFITFTQKALILKQLINCGLSSANKD